MNQIIPLEKIDPSGVSIFMNSWRTANTLEVAKSMDDHAEQSTYWSMNDSLTLVLAEEEEDELDEEEEDDEEEDEMFEDDEEFEEEFDEFEEEEDDEEELFDDDDI